MMSSGPTTRSAANDALTSGVRTPGAQPGRIIGRMSADPPPPRPHGVPAAAAWNPDMCVWEQAATGADGHKEGPFRQWRTDGSLCMSGVYRAGTHEGPFTRFHPNGAVARE